MAIDSLHALHEANISLSDRVSIIGINDMSISKYVYASLTTIKLSTEIMGEQGRYIDWEVRGKGNRPKAIKSCI